MVTAGTGTRAARTAIKAPGKALLFLATVAVSLRQGTAATSSAVDCSAESSVCFGNLECAECILLMEGEEYDAYVDCLSIDTGDAFVSCAVQSREACCQDLASSHDCVGNDLFVAYELCLVNQRLLGISGDQVEECPALDCTAIVAAEDTAGDDAGDAVGDDDECSAEFQSCYDDEECLECWAADRDEPEFPECMSSYNGDGLSNVCDDLLAGAVCCTNEVSANDCAANGAFVSYMACGYSLVSVDGGQGECSSTVTCTLGQAAGDEEDDAGGAAGIRSPLSIAMLALVMGAALFTAAPFSVL